jgi:hypothetical protein
MAAKKNPKASLETILAIGRRVGGEAPLAAAPVIEAFHPSPAPPTETSNQITGLPEARGIKPPTDRQNEISEPISTPTTKGPRQAPQSSFLSKGTSRPEGIGDFLAEAAQVRQAKDARQEAVETATCVFSMPVKKAVQEAASDSEMSVARWVMESFSWCLANGITPGQIADSAAWVAEDRNRKVEVEDGSQVPNRAAGSGVPIRASIYRDVVMMAKGVRPRLSNASVLEGCAIIRLHSIKPS